MNWITNLDTIIFDPDFNELLNHNLLLNYQNIIFSDYRLNNNLFENYKNNNFEQSYFSTGIL